MVSMSSQIILMIVHSFYRPLNPELEILYFSMIGPGSVSMKSDSTRIARPFRFDQVSATALVSDYLGSRLRIRTEAWTFEDLRS